MNGNEFVDTDAENVVVTSGDVTTISSTPAPDGSGDAVAAGGEAIAASLSPDGEVLNVAFMTGDGHAQIIQLRVSDLTRAREAARAGEPGTGAQAGSDDVIVIKGDLSTVSEAAICSSSRRTSRRSSRRARAGPRERDRRACRRPGHPIAMSTRRG